MVPQNDNDNNNNEQQQPPTTTTTTTIVTMMIRPMGSHNMPPGWHAHPFDRHGNEFNDSFA